jgi:hypothetical protein
MSAEDQMVQELGISRENIRKYSLSLGHIEAWGVGPDALSAYAGYQFLPNGGQGVEDLHAWPGAQYFAADSATYRHDLQKGAICTTDLVLGDFLNR